MAVVVGFAGWNLRKEYFDEFPEVGTHLERYAARMNGVEINSSFYRPHRRSTYQRWAESTPADFRFAVKLPKQMTHLSRLAGCAELLDKFFGEVAGLGEKLGPILVQLPPSFVFDVDVVDLFFRQLRSQTARAVVCEPRHASWFEPIAERCLEENKVGRVAVDLPVAGAAVEGHRSTCYYRFHGSPRTYYSRYDEPFLRQLASLLVATDREADEVWCIFDNTAEGAATENALELQQMLGTRATPGANGRRWT